MKKLIYFVSVFSASIVITDVVIVWDTAPAKAQSAKYALGQQQSLGLFPTGPMQPGPKLFKIECISQAEKDCEQQAPAVQSIPEPGTLALIGLGLIGLFWSRKWKP